MEERMAGNLRYRVVLTEKHAKKPVRFERTTDDQEDAVAWIMMMLPGLEAGDKFELTVEKKGILKLW
jgi:hypothetical protein